MRTVVMALMLFAVASGNSWAASGNPPAGYGEKKWGTKSTAGLKKVTGPTSDGTSLYTNTKPPQPLHGISIREESYSYTHGKLYNASAYLASKADLIRMKEALMKAHGSPDFSNDSKGIWKWKWPTAGIEITLYSQTVSYENRKM